MCLWHDIHFQFAYFLCSDISVSLAFGDSYTYVQGTYGHQNYSFIGDLQDFSYTPEELMSNEIIQNQVCLWLLPRIRAKLTKITGWYFSRRSKLGGISHILFLWSPIKMYKTTVGLCICRIRCLNNIVRPPIILWVNLN
jgi:hypothetical protein